MKVFVYWNLHKNVWSVKALEGENKGRVIDHAKQVTLYNCTFKVSQAGRARVIMEKRKNVHAGVVGYLSQPDVMVPVAQSIRVTYNPYRFNSFVNADNVAEPVTESQCVHMSADRSVLAMR
jgi:hypothetical protein